MEDAHIHVAPFSDKKYSLFGVFDGHGGSHWLMKGLRCLLLWKGISQRS